MISYISSLTIRNPKVINPPFRTPRGIPTDASMKRPLVSCDRCCRFRRRCRRPAQALRDGPDAHEGDETQPALTQPAGVARSRLRRLADQTGVVQGVHPRCGALRRFRDETLELLAHSAVWLACQGNDGDSVFDTQVAVLIQRSAHIWSSGTPPLLPSLQQDESWRRRLAWP